VGGKGGKDSTAWASRFFNPTREKKSMKKEGKEAECWWEHMGFGVA